MNKEDKETKEKDIEYIEEEPKEQDKKAEIKIKDAEEEYNKTPAKEQDLSDDERRGLYMFYIIAGCAVAIAIVVGYFLGVQTVDCTDACTNALKECLIFK